MKKLFLIVVFLIFSLPTFSQALENSNYYKSDITIYSSGKQNLYTFYFYVMSTGQIRMIDNEKNQYLTFKNYYTLSNSQTSVYTWVNNGGVWSESQTFVFTKDIVSGKLHVFSMRVVQNEGQDPWQTYGYGEVVKQ